MQIERKKPKEMVFGCPDLAQLLAVRLKTKSLKLFNFDMQWRTFGLGDGGVFFSFVYFHSFVMIASPRIKLTSRGPLCPARSVRSS